MPIYEKEHVRICYEVSEGIEGSYISISTAQVEHQFRGQGRYRKALDELQDMYKMPITLEAFETLVPMYVNLGFTNEGMCHPDGYYEMVRRLERKENMIMDPKDYLIGSYGADRHMPYCYDESNTGVAPNRCVVAVLSEDNARYVRDHIHKNYGYLIDQLKQKDIIFEGHFYENYVYPNCSRLEILDSPDNLSFGNFGLYRSNKILDTNHILISPTSSLCVRLETLLRQLDSYFFSHGIVPERFSKATAEAIESEISIILSRVDNRLSGVYSCSPIDISGGKTLVGFNQGVNGTLDCFIRTNYASFSGNGSMIGDIEKKRLSEIKEGDLIRMRPFMEEFCVRFKRYMPSFDNHELSQKQIKARSAYNEMNIRNNSEIKIKR